ncbi:DUF3801 domain-containing protein [Bacillus cereus]|uniref:DUF3801 domain-containing protein n=1 Tax=Bacillus TaxID=1386 RepID=UPI0024074B72|nr:DUF3801 domain-containing protein [Bacillus cereus]MDF9625112.1 DUF3801 domain-containing protein [Bacillus cereus]
MVTVDENTRIAMEIVAQSFKLSEQTLLFVLQSLTKLLENNENQPQDYILDNNTKVGKQKISDLIKKHAQSGGVIALDENLTKQQLQDYQKELKKLGVDFSVVRNGKEDYSFFFSATQANVIEKALKNIVERKIVVLNKEEVRQAEKDLKEVRQQVTPDQAKKVKEVYDNLSTDDQNKPKETNISYDRLSKQEKQLYKKLEELDAVKKGLYSQEVTRVETMFANRYKQQRDAETNKEGKGIEKENTVAKQADIPSQKPLEKVKAIFSALSEKEQALLQQKVNVVAGKESDNDFKKMKQNFSPEQIEKIEKIVSEYVSSAEKNVEEKWNPHVFSDILKKLKNETTKETTEQQTEGNKKQTTLQEKGKENETAKDKKFEFSMNGVKELDNKIKQEQKDIAKEKHKKQSMSR